MCEIIPIKLERNLTILDILEKNKILCTIRIYYIKKKKKLEIIVDRKDIYEVLIK
jgi:hypothetical protein